MRPRLRPHRGSHVPPHTRPIRFMLAALLVVPLASLIVLWAYETAVTAREALGRRDYGIQVSATSGPGEALLAQLGGERLQSFVLLTGPAGADRTPLNRQRARTNAAAAAFRRSALSAQAQGALNLAGRQDLATVLADLGRLNSIRAVVDTGHAGPLTMFEAYDRIVNDTFAFLGTQAAASSASVYQQAEAVLDMSRALDMTQREAALAAGAAVSGGRLNPGARGLFDQSVGAQRLLVSQAMPDLSPQLAAPFRHLFISTSYGDFLSLENQILAAPRGVGPVRVLPGGWQDATGPFLASFEQAVHAAQSQASAAVSRQGRQTLLRLGLTGGLGLLAILVSLLLLLRFGRRLARELTSLQRSARQVADERLPQVVGKLRQGDDVDPAAEAVPIEQGRTAEIALVAQALSTLQRSAIEAAAGQARLRHGVSQVFLNLSRRNQSLLHRQLSILDAMERGTSDPEALGDLFRLDHLTTRMRRHAEGLIILSGATPARGWRDPVPVIDVIRAAIAEVEDYVRVDVVSDTTDAVVGNAVADVVHLLAELIENATMFSPSTTRVEVRASRVGNGFAVEIEDRGIGLAPEVLAELNQRLNAPPEFDLADSDQLGLFVVSRLAGRHGVRVSLRESAYGGVAAIVLLPHSLVLSDDDARGRPGQPVVTQAPVPEPGFGLTGRRQALPAPPQAPRFMRPAPAPAAAATRPVPRLVEVRPPEPAPAPPREDPAATGPRPAESVTAWRQPEPAPATNWQPAASRPAAGGEYRGLPRRVRQASLAPQLKRDPPAQPEPAAAQVRSPEEARAMMAALQHGWQRGREDDEPAGAGPGAGWNPGSSEAPRGAQAEGEERS